MSLGHKINKSPLLSAKDAETFSEYPKTDLITSTWNVEHETSAGEGMQPLYTVTQACERSGQRLQHVAFLLTEDQKRSGKTSLGITQILFSTGRVDIALNVPRYFSRETNMKKLRESLG